MSDLAALVVQQSLNGVYLGCLYVMVALGLTLIYGVLNQINFAHADFVTVGAFTAFFTATRLATKVLGLPDTAGYLVSMVAAAGMAGALLGPVVVLTPFTGASLIVKAFAIVIIGGFGNMEGTIIAGLLVGVVEAFTVQYLGSGLIDLVAFALLLTMLAVRPTGLIAERKEENV